MAKTLLILGGRSDIGLAIAHEFASKSFDIVLGARDAAALEASRSDLEIRYRVKAYVAEFDAENISSHSKFYAELPTSPNAVVYSIGYLGDQRKAESDWDEAERIIKANFVGAASILSIAANTMASRHEGTIIGISSVAGDRGRQSNYIYGSAKSGFSTFLDGLRHRFAMSNVNVITVKPGFVDTKMNANINLPRALTARPDRLARSVFNAYCAKRSTLYYLPIWRWIMLAIRVLPERLFLKTKL